MNSKKIFLLGAASLVVLFVVFFYRFASINLFDSDFWWHVSTGRYIATTGSLPDQDPFSFVSTLEENKNLHEMREKFILKQYWLAQIIFYLIFSTTGPAGIILLRTFLLVMTLFFVFWRLQKWRVNLPLTFAFLFLLFQNLTRAIAERPVLFTIFFAAFTFFILEDFKEKKDKRIFLLLPAMILWANLHGGFILGVAIIMAFMIGEGIKIRLKISSLASREIALFYAAATLAIGFSLINPTGWNAFIIAFSPKYKIFTEGIQEYQSPLFYLKNKIYPVSYDYMSLFILFPVLLAFRNKKFDLTHGLLLSGLLFMALTATRFIVFYATIAAMVLGKETDVLIKGLVEKRVSEKTYSLLVSAIAVICLLSALVFAGGTLRFEKFQFGLSKNYSVPERAVNFIESNNLKGNMLNDFAYGGYLTWRQYPREKTFIDTRALNYTVMMEYSWITNAVSSIQSAELPAGRMPLWERLLEHYNIDTIFLSVLDVYGQVPPLIFRLTEGDKWIPVYSDSRSFIFIKNTKSNGGIIEKSKLSKDAFYNTVILSAASWALQNKGNYYYLVSIGQTFYTMGRLDDALNAYRYAMNRLPSPKIQAEIDKIESELRQKNRRGCEGV